MPFMWVEKSDVKTYLVFYPADHMPLLKFKTAPLNLNSECYQSTWSDSSQSKGLLNSWWADAFKSLNIIRILAHIHLISYTDVFQMEKQQQMGSWNM